jgi:hypothetical protein
MKEDRSVGWGVGRGCLLLNQEKKPMKVRSTIKTSVILALLILIYYSCKKDKSTDTSQTNNIIFTFTQKVNGASLKFDTMMYRTSIGNSYMITDLQYFISRVSLHTFNGSWKSILTDDGIHYIDASDNKSCTWWVNDNFPNIKVDSVSFVFGLDEPQNTSGRFPDPPQRDMFWPDILGGGYHYMKMNMKWENDTMTQSQPFMFHLGIGQIYKGNSSNPDSIIGFVQNYFKVSLPCEPYLVTNGDHQIILQMNIEKWFDGQNAFNFTSYPNGIMQDQQGMTLACSNGRKAFSLLIK